MEVLKKVETLCSLLYRFNCDSTNNRGGKCTVFVFLQVMAACVRYLNLLECQSKALLESNGVAIQKFRVVENVEEAKYLTQNFSELNRILLQILNLNFSNSSQILPVTDVRLNPSL
jgi:hypothetical protein